MIKICENEIQRCDVKQHRQKFYKLVREPIIRDRLADLDQFHLHHHHHCHHHPKLSSRLRSKSRTDISRDFLGVLPRKIWRSQLKNWLSYSYLKKCANSSQEKEEEKEKQEKHNYISQMFNKFIPIQIRSFPQFAFQWGVPGRVPDGLGP